MFKKKDTENTNEEMLEAEGRTDTANDEIESRLSQLQSELEQSKDQLLRRTAELDNMRRRHQAETVQLIFEANKRLITELLATIDDLERTISHIKPDDHTVLSDGIVLIYKNFQKILEKNNVKPIESVGAPFDVHLHDAMMEEPRADLEPGTITAEVQKGYMIGDTVLRHAKVIVAKRPE